MLSTLRGRLLASYLAIIALTLAVVAIALFGFATISSVRLLSPLQRLAAISRSNQNDLIRLWEAGGQPEDLQFLLLDTSDQTTVRIVIVDTADQEIVFDTTDDAWVGDRLARVDQPRLVLPGEGGDSIFGRFTHPDGSDWLVYAEPNPAFGRALIFYALPEPAAGEFFREFFLQPLVYAGLAALLLSILLAALITRSVARPLQEMASAAEAIAEGDYDQRVRPDGPDEVQRVAESFNTMTGRVNASQQAQRDFVANVSHDLKTPITAISGWSQALLDGAAATENEQQRAAMTIHEEAGRMLRQVDALLELARLESGQLQLAQQPVDLATTLVTVQRAYLPQAQEQGVALELRLEPAAPVMGDPDRLVQLFANLVDNALAHTPGGGEVTLRLQPDGKMTQAIVSDTGPGIPSTDLDRVFERFYQVDKSRKRGGGQGSGLGLAIVAELVDVHGGTVHAESEPGEGTSFVVRLPAI